MKAICIDDKPNKVLQYPKTYHKGFCIDEWLRSRFAPLSDIDETELIRERKTETA
jgi:hypothetical protein